MAEPRARSAAAGLSPLPGHNVGLCSYAAEAFQVFSLSLGPTEPQQLRHDAGACPPPSWVSTVGSSNSKGEAEAGMSRFHPGSPEEQQWSLGSAEVPPSDSHFLQPQHSGGGKGQFSPDRELPFSQSHYCLLRGGTHPGEGSPGWPSGNADCWIEQGSSGHRWVHRTPCRAQVWEQWVLRE